MPLPAAATSRRRPHRALRAAQLPAAQMLEAHLREERQLHVL